MISGRGKRLIIFLFLALAFKGLPFPEPLWAQAAANSQIKAFLRQGIARGFNLDEAGAIAALHHRPGSGTCRVDRSIRLDR